MTSAENTSRRGKLLEWRDWSLPVKLTAIVLVPLIFAVTLGISQIRWQVDRAHQYDQVTHVLDTINRVEPLVAELQSERQKSLESVLGTDEPGAMQTQTANVDKSVHHLDQVMHDSDEYDPVVYKRHDELHAQVDALAGVREKVEAQQLPPQMAIEAYNPVIQATLAMGRALSSTVADRGLSGTSTALQDMLVIMEEVRYQQVWVLDGLAEDSLSNQALMMMNGSRARLLNKVGDARATVATHWQRRLDGVMAGPEVLERNQILGGIIMASSANQSFSGMITAEEWNAKSSSVIELINDGHRDLGDEVRNGAAELEEDASNAAGVDSVLLLSALLLAAAVITTITRQLLASLRKLRRSALDSAQHDLPASVERIRQGDQSGTEVAPVPVSTTEEVGQLARAFDEVNRQALRLASEQAGLRRGYSDSFVSVSRRSQSLLERQLRLFEELEQDEEDPDQLATLFQLDHLATRMRRNNENLMVLSGSDLARRFTQPAPLADVLQSAVSEIEQYPRVIVQPPPTAHLVGHTASDLVRLVAELIDNAANFSSKETAVTVSSYQAGDGSITVDVLDEGIGMGNAELAQFNAQLAEASEADPATSRRMGLFVAARLAERHGIEVRLNGGSDVEGVRATVVVPSDYVISEENGRKRSTTTPAQGAQRNGTTHHELPTSGSFSTAMPQSEDPGFPKQEEFGGGMSLPKRDTSAPNPAPFGSVPPNSNEPDHDDFPTEHLFTPLDIPEQPRSEVPEFAWSWPEGEAESERPAPAPAPEPTREPSPMFEELSTQWFQPAGQEASSPEMAGETPDEFDWPATGGESGSPVRDVPASGISAASEARQQAEGAVKPASAPQIPTGLPRRNPSGQESSASVMDSGEDQRAPDERRKRLAEFDTGVRFGPAASVPRPSDSDSAPETSGEEAWNFASDEAWKRASVAANPDPTSFTPAGLPQRTPKAQLAPGSASAGAEEADGSEGFRRDADQLRGRLSSFQSGVQRGRHRAPDEG